MCQSDGKETELEVRFQGKLTLRRTLWRVTEKEKRLKRIK